MGPPTAGEYNFPLINTSHSTSLLTYVIFFQTLLIILHSGLCAFVVQLKPIQPVKKQQHKKRKKVLNDKVE